MDRKEQIKVVNSWLKDLFPVIGIELTLDSEGICSFKIGEDVIVIEVSHDYPMVHLYNPLLPFPEDKELKVTLLARALELNAFQVLTRGGAIASSPGGTFLIYCYSIPIEEIDSEKFSAILGAFYETLPELKKLLAAPSVLEDLPSKGHVKI